MLLPIQTEQQVTTFWAEITKGLGPDVDLAVLSAIAVEGYKILGRGSVRVDTSTVTEQLVTYIGQQYFLPAISGDGAEALADLLETYDPETQFIVSVLLPTDHVLCDMQTFVMDQESIAQSPTAQAMVACIQDQGLVARGNNLN